MNSTETSAQPAIETKLLTLCRDKSAVNAVDLRVDKGILYGFLGHNGAGKSTTIKMLTGLLAPTSGSVQALGFDMLDVKQSLEAKRYIGVIPENLALFDNLTAKEYLTFVGRIHGLTMDTIRQRSEELLHLLSLENETKKLTLEYSHGMRKTLLGSCLVTKPETTFLG